LLNRGRVDKFVRDAIRQAILDRRVAGKRPDRRDVLVSIQERVMDPDGMDRYGREHYAHDDKR
jgi:hypothetical protein